MDVLLINPKNSNSQTHEIMPPLGLNSIGNVLEKSGFSIKILDLELYPTNFNLLNYIKILSPKVVGIGGTTYSRFESFKIADTAKNVSNDIFTVYGGYHASFTAEDTLSHIKNIDYIVRGEGELTFLELVNLLILNEGKAENIGGVSFRKNGIITHNTPRKRILNLDSIPYSRHLLETDKYTTKLEYLNIPAASIITARGCPYDCAFCSAAAMFGNIYTTRSAKNVINEIEYCIERFNIKGIKFFDNTLSLNRSHITSLIEEIKTKNISLPWECEIRADTVDRPLLAAMKEAGCYYVNFGVESASDKILNNISKGISIEQAVDVMQWCQELGIKTKVFFSFGHIGETWDDSKKTFDFINKYDRLITHISKNIGIRIYPGTAVERYARQNNLLPLNFSWSGPFKDINAPPIITDNVPLLLQPQYGIKELKKCYDQAYKIEFKRDIKEGGNIWKKIINIRSFPDLIKKLSRLIKVLIS